MDAHNYSELFIGGEIIKMISADSHVTEPPNCYIDNIDPKFRDRAPHVERVGAADVYVVEGSSPIKMGLVASAGRAPQDLVHKYNTFDQLHAGGWDGKARIAEQDIDGVAGEIIYPTIGMLISGQTDTDLTHACMQAYNRWLEGFVAGAPDRLFGIGQTAVRSVAETIDDMEQIKRAGFKGVMFPCHPSTDFDYDDPRFDPIYQASIDLNLPISFHTFGGRKVNASGQNSYRGLDAINMWNLVIRDNQDIMGMLIFGRIFERHPKLKIVCVEADAGWVPHYLYAMDRIYNRHRYWKNIPALERQPSEYFRENVYLTFQDDATAFDAVDRMNVDRLLWANDHPHSDATWPNSRLLLQTQTAGLTDHQKQRILRDNVRELYDLPM